MPIPPGKPRPDGAEDTDGRIGNMARAHNNQQQLKSPDQLWRLRRAQKEKKMKEAITWILGLSAIIGLLLAGCSAPLEIQLPANVGGMLLFGGSLFTIAQIHKRG